MAEEMFLVTALPYSVDPASDFHVSLFISPRLTPDGSRGDTLAEFAHFSEWTATLAGATFRLLDGSHADIACTPLLKPLDEALWAKVFPVTTQVNPWRTADPAADDWRSFDATAVHDHAMVSQVASALASPLDPPTVQSSPLARAMLPLLGWNPERGSRPTFDALARFEEERTTELDSLVDDPPPKGQLRGALQMLADLHAARRFYDRPEQQTPYQQSPTPGASRPRPEPIKPDFHQRCTMLGDYPALERRLGLVIDLRVDDLGALAAAGRISAEVLIDGLVNRVAAQPETRCHVASTVPGAFVSTPRDGDWLDGALRIADTDRFSVLHLDPDASALKLESFVRTLPRLAWADLNGDPGHAAPPSLRASGFAIARADRAQRLRDQVGAQQDNEATLGKGGAPELSTEDVTRGIRMEVWDDASRRWHTLHARLSDVVVMGVGRVISGLADEGFLQGAALTKAGSKPTDPSYLHQVLAGWEGWSLAAPRPGLTIVHDDTVDGGEKVVDVTPEATTVTPVVVSTRSAPDSLPRLRYGRRYALRIWAADLAGNSVPHERGSSPVADGAVTATLETLASELIAARAGRVPIAAGTLSTELRQARVDRQLAGPAPVTIQALTSVAVVGDHALDRLIVSRLLPRLTTDPTAAPGRAAAVTSAFGLAADDESALVADAAARGEPANLAAALGAAAGQAVVGADTPTVVQQVNNLSQVVTEPRPFLRWDPVPPPVVIPRFAYTDGESLRRLVIRSGVALSAPADTGGTIVITDPHDYAAATGVSHPGLHYRETGERHLAAPKTSQFHAELHGSFDAAIGSTDPVAQRRALGIALRESGTFLDVTVADIDNPGKRLPQPDVALLATPDADPSTNVTLADIANRRGTALGRGQYVVHSGTSVVVPYLPDPMATGISLVFPDAGHDRPLPAPFGTEGVAVAFLGKWPEPVPVHLILAGGPQLSARVDGSDLHIDLPPGEQLRFRLASSLAPGSLDRLGLWRQLPPELRANPDVVQAALDGWLWFLTPGEEIELVHAVQRPVEIPRPTLLQVIRSAGDTAAILFGAVDVHGPSTERLDVEASWEEQVDDITADTPETVQRQAAACHTSVGRDEDLVVLFGQDFDVPIGATVVHVHKAVHQLGDTHHRVIDYRMRATTRYREYFSPAVVPTVDDLSVVGPTRRLSVPSTARPGRPVVRSVVPLFRWDEGTEPEQPFGLRRRRRAGLRIYLERPWFSSGDGELLGVILATGSDARLTGSVSAWASDPVWLQQGPAGRAALPISDLLHDIGLADEIEPARPVAPPVQLPLVDLPGQPAVTVLGYRPEYSTARKLWFVDVAFDPGTAFWPFVRLAVARYQPDSLAGMHLSPVVLCDFAQLAPERTATLTRPDDRRVRVVVSGPIGTLAPVEMRVSGISPAWVGQSRLVRARLQQRDPAIGTDLGWTTRAERELEMRGNNATVVAWEGTLDLPDPMPAVRPGADADWRVVVEEYEGLPADRSGNLLIDRQLRLVYADELPL